MTVSYVNKKALPGPLADAITFSDFAPSGTLSAPRLIDAPQVAFLKRHNNLEDDVSEKVWMLINKALVQVVENGDTGHRARRAFATVSTALVGIQNTEVASTSPDKKSEEWLGALGTIIQDLDTIVSEYFPAEQDRFLVRQSYGVEISESFAAFKGTDKEFPSQAKATIFDTIPLYDKHSKTLYYTRICNTYHATKPELRNAWVRESNVQAYILHHNGIVVEKIAAVMIFKDFQPSLVGNRKDYPSSQVEVVALPLHPIEKTDSFVRTRLRQHLRADMGDVALCSPSDRWADADTYVVLRPGSNHVKKKAFTYDEAVTWLAQNRVRLNDGYVSTRAGRSKRCESWCPVRDVCPQWKKEREEMLQEPPASE